jgi:nitrite reductase (NO-forming)
MELSAWEAVMSQTVLDSPGTSPEPGPAPPQAAPSREAGPPLNDTGRSGWTLVGLLFGGLILFFALMTAMMVIIEHNGGSTVTTGNAASPAGATTTGPTSATVMEQEFSITPADTTLAPGGTLQVMNMGTMPHNLAVEGTNLATAMISPGDTKALKLTGLAPGTYTIYCQVPGHEAAGMKANLHITGASTANATATAASTGGASTSATDAKVSFSATPGPTWHAFDPTLAPAPGATVHNVTFHVQETTREVAPGVTQQAWTFNGQVPGPILRGHIGDVFNVTLVNDGTMGHSIDFHASQTAPNVDMRTINPGQSLVYPFKADYAGIWMYHCGTAPAIEHIANGMFGAVIIDPPNLAPVAHEFVMIQSELYLGPQGQPGDMSKMLADKPDAVVFNGYVNQYKYAPIAVDPGQRIRIWVLDAGPNDISSFHIVGTIFDTVFKEGHYELQPGNATGGGSQALDLDPAQGGFVETTFAQPGVYTMVSHKFADASQGDLGTFDVGGVIGTMNH